MSDPGTPCPRSECSGTLERDHVHRTQNCATCRSAFTDEMLSNVLFISALRPFRAMSAGGSLAATPCQMMLGGGPGSPDERPCGVTPTVGGNRLHRYCAAHLAMVAHAGGTVYRDADADLKIDANGEVVRTPTGTFECTASGLPIGKTPLLDTDPTLTTAIAAARQDGAFIGWRGNGRSPDDVVAWLDERVLVHGGYPPTHYSCKKCSATLARYTQTTEALITIVKTHRPNCLTDVGSNCRLPDDTTFNAWPAAASPRPDGFSQAQVDAAKAVLLAPVAKRGGR